MRRLSRIDRPAGLLKRQTSTRLPSPYLCLACKHRATSFSTSSLRAAPPDNKTPFTEKLRQRIWGTDKPPGLEDPYGEGSVIDRTKKKTQSQKLKEQELERQELEKHELEKQKLDNQELESQASVEVEETAEEVDQTELDYDFDLADNWEGLRRIGRPVWQPENDFEGYLRADAVADPDVITGALRLALIEVFALHQSGRPLSKHSSHFPDVDVENRSRDWRDYAQIISTSNGVEIEGLVDSFVEDNLEDHIGISDEAPQAESTESGEYVDAERSDEDPLETGTISSDGFDPEQIEQVKSEIGSSADHAPTETSQALTSAEWDPSWLQISLENPEIKFAVLKRTMQLTGIRISDAAIKSSNTVKAFLNIIVAPPKPTKLFDALEQRGELQELGNVAIYPARRGFKSKEQDIGRLKVIEEALEKHWKKASD